MTDLGLAIADQVARDRPAVVARRLEGYPPEAAAELVARLPREAALTVWERLSPDLAAEIFTHLPDSVAERFLRALAPTPLANMLVRFDEAGREAFLAGLPRSLRREVEGVLAYPEGSAGRRMDPRFLALRPEATVEQALGRLRRGRGAAVVYVVDDELRLQGRVPLERLALASAETRLEDLAEGVVRTVAAVEPMEDVIDAFAGADLPDLPVVDVEGRLVGHFRQSGIAALMQNDATADMQTMVGASRDERALSPISFAFRRRAGWLQINLLTAFLAATVVGLFEDTIARFTALAVLLPVVAGQSGNAGAQALAVTMRGLAVREIATRHWLRVTWKEASVGLLNGLAVAVTCGIGVFVWSGSPGLVAVISLAMVLAMVAAGLAGALVPIILARLGQDPAVASSIVLTTVTDVAGFFAFLGIASLLIGFL